MALTRARVVAATSREIDHRTTTVIRTVLAAPRDPDRLAVDVMDMRTRIAGQHRSESPWNVKHRPGGLVDIEFIAQYLQLLHGPAHPRVFAENTAEALAAMREAGLLEEDAMSALVGALRLWWRLQNALRLIAPELPETESVADTMKAALARACGMAEFDSLVAAADAAADSVREQFQLLVERPAGQARARLPAGEGDKS
jgi:glutamate-ammonia-ligase adenylyltransferase